MNCSNTSLNSLMFLPYFDKCDNYIINVTYKMKLANCEIRFKLQKRSYLIVYPKILRSKDITFPMHAT